MPCSARPSIFRSTTATPRRRAARRRCSLRCVNCARTSSSSTMPVAPNNCARPRLLGARLVFTSRSPRLRWKAFRVSWLRLLDEHWIVFPQFVTGGLSSFERLKVRPDAQLRRPPPRHAVHAVRARRARTAGSRRTGCANAVTRPSSRAAAARLTARGGRSREPLHRRRRRVRADHRPDERRADGTSAAGAARGCERAVAVAAARAAGGRAAPARRRGARRLQRRHHDDPRARARPGDRLRAARHGPGAPDPARRATRRRRRGRARRERDRPGRSGSRGGPGARQRDARQAAALGLVNGVDEAVAALQRLARPAYATYSLQEA